MDPELLEQHDVDGSPDLQEAPHRLQDSTHNHTHSHTHPHKTKQYYRLWLLPYMWVGLHFDRLTLLALFDRYTQTHTLLCITDVSQLISLHVFMCVCQEPGGSGECALSGSGGSCGLPRFCAVS